MKSKKLNILSMIKSQLTQNEMELFLALNDSHIEICENYFTKEKNKLKQQYYTQLLNDFSYSAVIKVKNLYNAHVHTWTTKEEENQLHMDQVYPLYMKLIEIEKNQDYLKLIPSITFYEFLEKLGGIEKEKYRVETYYSTNLIVDKETNLFHNTKRIVVNNYWLFFEKHYANVYYRDFGGSVYQERTYLYFVNDINKYLTLQIKGEIDDEQKLDSIFLF